MYRILPIKGDPPPPNKRAACSSEQVNNVGADEN